MGLSTEIIKRCKKGDRRAIKEFYQISAGWMLGICLRYVRDRNEAMSIVNMSLLKALEKLDDFDNRRGEKIEAWLKTILIRKAIDYMRKENLKFSEDLDAFSETAQFVASESIEGNLGKKELLAMINSLNPSTKAVFNLFAIEGFKHKEIAKMLHISIGTSKWHLNDARTRLKAMIIKSQEIKLNR